MLKQVIILFALVGAVLCEDKKLEDAIEADEIVSGYKQLAADAASGQFAQEEIKEKERNIDAKPRAAMKDNLIDLAIIGGEGAKQAYQNSKPILSNIKNTIGAETKNLGQKINDNKHVQGIWSKINPHYQRSVEALKPHAKNLSSHLSKLNQQVKPYVNQGIDLAKPYLDKAEQRRRELMKQHEERQALLKQQQLEEEERKQMQQLEQE